ncbi:hypothetical protein J2W14_001642 [Pseudarthrobacter oxydans]|uniref:hypothetical protein n=1 Tax=Pseudarthrobacter oxydans TaxID=1671 RepID=UPI002787521A|nr:hypothetical protein [Pseudarthrobacter oxydans]MDP9982254.1 hypothetical protein [Pseudarthrobacter oxydans]
MLGKKSRWIAPLAASAVVLLAASSAGAAPDDVTKIVIPASESCDTFDLGLTSNEGNIRVIELSNGNVYQVGTGRILTWSNEETGETYTVKTSGSVARYVLNPDGKSYTLTLSGHNGFVYFSADRPADEGGAGAYQYTGLVVLQVDSPKTNNVSNVDATAGKAVDICELLK